MKTLKIFKIYLLSLSLYLSAPLQTYAADTTSTRVKDDGNKYYIENEQKVPDSDAGMLESITLAAAVIPAPTLALGCLDKMSVMSYLGTSVYYIGAEIFDFGEYEEGSEAAMEIVKGSDQDKQVKAINAAYEETNEAAELATAKSGRAQAAAMGFALATGLALWESTKPDEGKCKKSKDKDDAKLIDTTEDSATKDEKNKTKNSDKTESKDKSKININKLKVEDGNNNLNTTWIKILGFFVPEAIAKTTAAQMGIFGGVAGAAITHLWEPVNSYVKKNLDTGIGRAVLFGALAGLSYIVSKKHENIAEDLQKRADQYKALADRLNGLGSSGGIGGSGGTVDPAGLDDESEDNTSLSKEITEEKTNCFTGDTGELKADKGCSCEATNSCKRSEFANMDFTPIDSTGAMSDSAKMVQGISEKAFAGDDFSSKSLLSANLEKNAKKMSDLNKKLEKKKNNQLKSAGKKAINFDKRKKAAIATLKSKVKDSLKNLKPIHYEALKKVLPKKFSNSNISSLASKGNINSIKKKTNETKKEKEVKQQVNIPQFDFEYKRKKQSANNSYTTNGDNKYLKSKYKYNTKKEIIKRPQTGLFKIITIRYMKSAYPILLEREAI